MNNLIFNYTIKINFSRIKHTTGNNYDYDFGFWYFFFPILLLVLNIGLNFYSFPISVKMIKKKQ